MLKPLLAACIALSVYSSAYAQSRTEVPSASNALKAAIDGCLTTAATGRLETRSPTEIYMAIGRSMGSVKSINDAPEIVKRFIGTSSGGIQPQFVYRFRSDKGGIWAVARTMVDRCDMVITGMDEQSIGVEATAFFNASAGWQTIVKHDPVPSAPLGRYIFVKPMPQPGLPNYGLVATIKNLGTTAGTADGVQLEINIAAGNISNTAGSISVKTVRPPPNPGRP